MTIFGDWIDGGAGEYPGRARLQPASWKVTSLGEYWFDPDVDGLEAPTATTDPNELFSETWPGAVPASSRGWASYWSQTIDNLNALILRTVRDDDGYSTYLRDIAQQVRFDQWVNAYHPAFSIVDPDWPLIQFEDEDEPHPVEDGHSTRGRPTIFGGYRARLSLAAESDAPFYAEVKTTSIPGGRWVTRDLDGLDWRYGVIDADTGAPTGWTTEHSSLDTTAAVDISITDVDEGGWHDPLLIALDVAGGSGDRTVDVAQIEFFASVEWPQYRFAREAGGIAPLRARGRVNSGGPPIRARYRSGITGGPLSRSRHTAI